MARQQTHESHSHTHGPNCGHSAVQHEGHTDYLHDGHLHHASQGKVEEHRINVDSTNPSTCTPGHDCGGHEKSHVHGQDCGHEAVPHGDHTDYVVKGHLHHSCSDHCDDHGTLKAA